MSATAAAQIKSHRDLIAWQKAMDLVVLIYECTAGFPRHELYGLTSQIRRAATSIPANIAEGQGRIETRVWTVSRKRERVIA